MNWSSTLQRHRHSSGGLLPVQSLCLLLFLVLSLPGFVWGHASDSLFLTPHSREETSAQPARPLGSPGTGSEDAGAVSEPLVGWDDREQPPYLHLLRQVKRVQVSLLQFHQAPSGKTTHLSPPFSPFFEPCQCVIEELDLGEAFAQSSRHKSRCNLWASLPFSRGWLRSRGPCVE